MSKYTRLGEYLKAQKTDQVPMTFAEIERVTGAKLPPSADKYRPWWSNNPDNSVLTKIWIEAGFKSEQVDMAARKLVFRRMRAPTGPAAPSGEGPQQEAPFHPAYGAMKGLVRVMPGTDLTQPADPDWAARLDAQYGKEKR